MKLTLLWENLLQTNKILDGIIYIRRPDEGIISIIFATRKLTTFLKLQLNTQLCLQFILSYHYKIQTFFVCVIFFTNKILHSNSFQHNIVQH